MEENKQEEENQLQEEKTQSDVDSPKDRGSATQGVEVPAYKAWSWLHKHKYEVLFGFLVAVISGFLVTMLGVWAAFGLAGWGEQNAFDRATKQRLHLVVLEAQYNGTDAKEILDNYADAKSFGINLNRPNSFAAIASLQDANILLILPLHKVSLLRTYVNSISTLNKSLQVHQGVLESQNYKDKGTPQEDQARQNVHENAAAVFAACRVLQEELKGHFDESLYDRKEAKKIEDRIKYIKRKALKGEVSLSREN